MRKGSVGWVRIESRLCSAISVYRLQSSRKCFFLFCESRLYDCITHPSIHPSQQLKIPENIYNSFTQRRNGRRSSNDVQCPLKSLGRRWLLHLLQTWASRCRCKTWDFEEKARCWDSVESNYLLTGDFHPVGVSAPRLLRQQGVSYGHCLIWQSIQWVGSCKRI